MPIRMTACAVGIVLGACLLLSGCSSGKSGADSRVYRMGEPVAAGSLIYSVSETEWHQQLGEGPTARLPQYRFLVVRLTVTNSGARSSAIPALALVDPAGQTYLELTEGPGVPDWMGYLRTVSPAQTERGAVVFDAPPNTYRLRVSDDAEPGAEKFALIELPLQLVPVVPLHR